VNHPAIDGAIQLHDEFHPLPDQIAAVRLHVAPLVLDLCNQQNITKGLQGKFSVYHGAAVGLVRGKAGIQEYTDATVNDPAVRRVRERATAVGEPAITEDQARVDVEMMDGRVLSRFVEASIGNLARPLTDRQLDTKFRDQAVLALTAPQVDDVLASCWRIDTLDDVGEFVAGTIPIGAKGRATKRIPQAT
jgi:2-methylcitrate dehydratase PrpD